MTDKIYEKDSYCRSFSATVQSCEEKDGTYRVVLDKTAFFPEGGGQAADTGWLDGIEVLDVQQEGDLIIHKISAELPVGSEVKGEIDWDLRYSRMQSHTGEHILSGIAHSLFGYNNIGFHMSESVMLVDLDGKLSQSDIEKIEIESNKAIYKNADITASYPSVAELEKLNYRSKIELREGTRIVTIGDIDCCACCAPHLAKTGEVGLIKIVDFYPNKQGTRIEMLAGINALIDYCDLNTANKGIMKILSAPRQGIVEAVSEQNAAMQALRGENQKISRRLALCELEQMKISDSVYAIAKDLSYDELRYCANDLTENGNKICILLSENQDGSFNYVVSSRNDDIRTIVKSLNESFNGKGGGKNNYAQGKISSCSKDDIKKFIEEAL